MAEEDELVLLSPVLREEYLEFCLPSPPPHEELDYCLASPPPHEEYSQEDKTFRLSSPQKRQRLVSTAITPRKIRRQLGAPSDGGPTIDANEIDSYDHGNTVDAEEYGSHLDEVASAVADEILLEGDESTVNAYADFVEAIQTGVIGFTQISQTLFAVQGWDHERKCGMVYRTFRKM